MSVVIGMPETELHQVMQRWLTQHLPDAREVVVHRIDLPDNGASNITGLVDASWTDADGDQHETLVLRTVSVGEVQLYEEYDLVKQYRVVECLAPTEIKVARLVGYEGDTSLLGREFYVMHNTGGRAVAESPSYHLSGWFAELTDEQRRTIWMEGVDTIAAIHQLDWESLGLGFVAGAGTGDVHDRFLARHSELLHWMERRNDKSYARLRRIYDWLEANYPRDTPTSMLWADAKLGNLMIDGTTIVGVLDWEHCTLGPCLYDVANWMIFDRLMSIGPGRSRLSGLPTREETVQRYEAATGRPATDITYFELFSAVRLTNVVYGAAGPLIVAGKVPPDFEENNGAAHAMNRQLERMGLSF
jgi:aminoglycoside phosphotransferase (APT) family kinase protein